MPSSPALGYYLAHNTTSTRVMVYLDSLIKLNSSTLTQLKDKQKCMWRFSDFRNCIQIARGIFVFQKLTSQEGESS